MNTPWPELWRPGWALTFELSDWSLLISSLVERSSFSLNPLETVERAAWDLSAESASTTTFVHPAASVSRDRHIILFLQGGSCAAIVMLGFDWTMNLEASVVLGIQLRMPRQAA